MSADDAPRHLDYCDECVGVTSEFDHDGRRSTRNRRRVTMSDDVVVKGFGDLLEAIVDVQRWSDQHDHPVAEWFQGGESA